MVVKAIKILFHLLFFMVSIALPSKADVNISDLLKGELIGSRLDILRSEVKLSIEDVLIRQAGFEETGKLVPRFGYTHDDIWARLKIDNDSGSEQLIFFEIKGPIEYVDAYLVQDKSVLKNKTAGMSIYPQHESTITYHVYPVISFYVPEGTSEVFFSERAVAPHFPIVAHSEATFESQKTRSNVAIYVLFGVCITFFIILICTSFMARSIASIFLLCSFIGFFFLNGFVTGMFRPLQMIFGPQESISSVPLYMHVYRHWPVFLSIYFLSLSLFAVNHSGVENFFKPKALRYLIIFSIVSQALMGLVSILDTVWAMNLFSIAFNIVMIAACIISFKRARQGYTEDIFTFSAWLVFGTFSSLQLFYFLGFTEQTIFAFWGTVFGFVIMLFLLSISLIVQNKQTLISSLNRLENNFKELKKRDEIIQVFSNPRIVTELNLGLNPMEFEARSERWSVMSHDMRGFTRLTENLTPQEVGAIVNLYTAKIFTSIVNNNGDIDKTIGDAVLACFDNPDSCFKSILDIRMSLSEINRERVKDNKIPCKFGTGIAYGDVWYGNFGSNIKMDRTIIGDAANSSKKVEALTKYFQVDVLMDDSFYQVISNKENTRIIGSIKIDTKENPLLVYEFFGHLTEKARDFKNYTSPFLERIVKLSTENAPPMESLQIVEKLIQECPPHSYKQGVLLDPTLSVLQQIYARKEK